MKKSFLNFATLALLACAGLTQNASASDIVKRPEELKFPPLDYHPPNPADYRVQLKSGPVAYVIPDRTLPLVNISVLVRVGTYVEPAGKEGLAPLTGDLLARGGTKEFTAEALEEKLAFLAAQLNSSVGDTEGSVSLNLLSKDLDEGLKILRGVLAEPRFQDDKIALRKEQMLQEMKQRNDQSEDIESREYSILRHGENFFENHFPTKASVDSITREDMENFHRKWFHPDDFVLAVSGDFDRDEMIGKLEKLFSDWPYQGEKPPAIPTDTELAKPGVYIVDKDVNQGRVTIQLPGIMRDSPDYFAAQVMNDILGGGGFTSHIMSKVRSDEGLAYAAYSSFPGGIYYPATFTAEFQSKSRTVTYAASIVLQEMKKMMEKPPTAQELSISKHGYVDRFPHRFATKAATAGIFAQDEFTGQYAKDPNYWKDYRSHIEAVNADDVERVAKKYMNPERAVILIVGNKNDISMKMPDHPVALQELTSGPVTELPLRDPLTMKPMAGIDPQTK